MSEEAIMKDGGGSQKNDVRRRERERERERMHNIYNIHNTLTNEEMMNNDSGRSYIHRQTVGPNIRDTLPHP